MDDFDCASVVTTRCSATLFPFVVDPDDAAFAASTVDFCLGVGLDSTVPNTVDASFGFVVLLSFDFGFVFVAAITVDDPILLMLSFLMMLLDAVGGFFVVVVVQL